MSHDWVVVGSQALTFEQKGEIIQRGASTAPENPSLTPIDDTVPASLEHQITSFHLRLRDHMVNEVGAELFSKVDSIKDAISDCEMCIRGVLGAIVDQSIREYSTDEAKDILTRSYGVVRRVALDQGSLVEKGFGILNSSQLLFVETDKPFVTVKDESDIPSENMPCPAFIGKPTKAPRLPVQLWRSIVEIYQYCGEIKLIKGIGQTSITRNP